VNEKPGGEPGFFVPEARTAPGSHITAALFTIMDFL